MPDSSMRLILASASPRRAELLRASGFAFDVAVTNVDESIRAGESPQTYVRRLAAEKSAAAPNVVARAALQEIVILGADTAVGGRADHPRKPRGDEESAGELRRLWGRGQYGLSGIRLRSRALP